MRVDSGSREHLALELPNVKIGGLALFPMTSPAERPYRAPTPSRYFENFWP